jgi:hypothetical protein
MYPGAIVEARTEDFRYDVKETFDKLFPFKARGYNKRNSEGERIYRPFYGEDERLPIRILKYEAERMRGIPKLRSDLGFVARNMADATPSPSKPSPSKRWTTVVRKLGKMHLIVRSMADRESDKFPLTKLYDPSALKELDLNRSEGKLPPRRSCETSQKRSLTK